MSRTPVLAIPLLFLILTGFGCKTRTTGMTYPIPISITTPRAVSSTPPAIFIKDPKKPKDVEPGTSPDIILLRQVMKNLIAANSFRAMMSIPTENGTMQGDIEFSRGKGLHGLLKLPNQSSTEIYLVNQNVLFRANTSTWTNLAFTPEGTRLATLFGAAFSLQGTGTSSTISDSARILSTYDDPSGCKLYIFQQPIAESTGYEKIDICVKDNLPQFFRVATQSGNVEIHYRDFNEKIEIVSPIK